MGMIKRIFGRGDERAGETIAQGRSDHLLLDYDNAQLVHPAALKANSIFSIPPVWCAIDFLSGTLASLPIRVHDDETHETITKTPESKLLSRAPAPGRTPFDWKYSIWKNVFSKGSSITYISRSRNGRVMRLYWDIDPTNVERVVNKAGDIEYRYTDKTNGTKIWPAADVIDVAWMRSIDGLSTYSPVATHQDVFQLAVAFHKYQQKFASTGGIPPWVLKSRWSSPTAIKQGWKDVLTLIRTAQKKNDMVVPIGKDMDIMPLGISPEQGQILQTQQFVVRQICRVYGLPPIYLHDLDRMTYANAEHQGLTLTKYTLTRWAEQLEQQISLKVLGGDRVARHDMKQLLRGDYVSRSQGHQSGIFSGQLTPNEARAEEDRPPLDNGDELFMQSGTMPIDQIKNQEGGNDPQSGIPPGENNPGE